MELRLGIAVLPQVAPGQRHPEPEPLHVAEDMHGLGQEGIAVVGHPVAEVLAGDLAVEAAGVLDLDPVVEPVDPHGGVGRLVVAVDQGVAGKLAQGGDGVVRPVLLPRPCLDVHRDLDMDVEKLIQLGHDAR